MYHFRPPAPPPRRPCPPRTRTAAPTPSRPDARTKPPRQNPMYQSAPPPRPTSARQNPLYHFRPPAPPPRRPRPPGTRTPPHTPPRPAAHTQTASQNPLYQRAHPARAKPPRQNPMHQSPPPPRPSSRPGCPTAPRGGDGCASSAACTGPRPPAPTHDRAPGHHAVKCNGPGCTCLPPFAAAVHGSRLPTPRKDGVGGNAFRLHADREQRICIEPPIWACGGYIGRSVQELVLIAGPAPPARPSRWAARHRAGGASHLRQHRRLALTPSA